MIKDILNALKEYLSYNMEDGLNIVLNSVKKEKGTEEEDVVITLLRIEEETSRKPQQPYYTETLQQGDKTYKKVYPASPNIEINLEILISSHASKYESALIQISDVISLMNSIKTATKPAKMDTASFNLLRTMSVSMMNMTFDQHLGMWQTLGAVLVPSVAYKIRMVTVAGVHVKKEGPLVLENVIEPGDNTNERKNATPESLPARKTSENEKD